MTHDLNDYSMLGWEWCVAQCAHACSSISVYNTRHVDTSETFIWFMWSWHHVIYVLPQTISAFCPLSSQEFEKCTGTQPLNLKTTLKWVEKCKVLFIQEKRSSPVYLYLCSQASLDLFNMAVMLMYDPKGNAASMYISLCIFVYVYMSMYICLCIYVYVYMSMYACLCIHVYACVNSFLVMFRSWFGPCWESGPSGTRSTGAAGTTGAACPPRAWHSRKYLPSHIQ